MTRDPRPPTAAERAFVARARRATLATSGSTGRPRPVPVCFVLLDDVRRPGWPILYSPIDEKPKRATDPLQLARVRDLLARPAVALLADHWDEDWGRLGWVRLDGRAGILAADAGEERARAVTALRAKYPQYRQHALGVRPIIRIEVDGSASWGRLEPPALSEPR
jgi:PPOX class probable F420-dependent enzyme